MHEPLSVNEHQISVVLLYVPRVDRKPTERDKQTFDDILTSPLGSDVPPLDEPSASADQIKSNSVKMQ